MQAWLDHSLRRYYPSSPQPGGSRLRLHAARGERLSFQAIARTGAEHGCVRVRVHAPEGLEVRTRRVGYVPVPHLNTETPEDDLEGVGLIPGYAPDPLLTEDSVEAGPFETHSFWVTVSVPPDAAPGDYPIRVELQAKDALPSLAATLTVHPATAQPRHDFPVTHWFYADAIADWYRVEPWSEPFWEIVQPYLRNLVEHGQDTIYFPLLTPPLDGVKRPTQLLGITAEGGRYSFDWSQVRRWVASAREAGLSRFEWTHLATQWGARHAIRVYEGHGETAQLLWPPETPATSDTYHAFLAQLLPELRQFLLDEGLMEHSLFHLSDEPHGEEHLRTYRAAREMLRELAPWMRVMDALGEPAFALDGLTDTPVSLVSSFGAFTDRSIQPWAYYCCEPRGRYLNRLIDTPLPKIRMSGWLFYRLGASGFLHWGYNYWYRGQTTQLIDPYTVLDGCRWPDWAHGDPFLVYPGHAGPVDSIRWEVFAESLQDYALLQAANVAWDDPLLEGIHDFARFPRGPEWILERRRLLLERLAG